MADLASPENLETLDLKEAARLLRAGYETTKELVESGAIPAVCLNQKHTVILREEVLAYVRDEGRRQAAIRKAKSAPVKKVASVTTRGKTSRLPDLAHYERLTTGAQPASRLAS